VESETEADSLDESEPFEVNAEADSIDITAHLNDDQPGSDQRASEDSLNVHLRKQAEVRLYSCRECGKSFCLRDSLHRHMNVHNSTYKCPECGKCFRGSYQLARHRMCHSGEKPFVCTVCSKRFAEARYLVKHNRIHREEKVLYCRTCDSSFDSTRALSNHMRVHAGDRAYKCSLCKESFSQSSCLQTHECRVHSDRRLFETNRTQNCHVDTDSTEKSVEGFTLPSHSEGTCYFCINRLAVLLPPRLIGDVFWT